MENFEGYENWLKDNQYGSWKNYLSYLSTVIKLLDIPNFKNIQTKEELEQLRTQLQTNLEFLKKDNHSRSTILSGFNTYIQYKSQLQQNKKRVWRIGSNWGGRDIQLIFKEYQIAFAGKEVEENFKQIVKGDLVAITSGQSIVAVGMATELLPLSSIYTNYLLEFEDVHAVKLSPLYWAESFRDIQFGIYDGRGKQFHEAHGNYSQSINELFIYLSTQRMENKIIDVLKYKKQIILQGPPGTGKTRKAKELAAAMIGFTQKTDISDNDITIALKDVKQISTIAGKIEYELISVNSIDKLVMLKKSTAVIAPIAFEKIKQAYANESWNFPINNNDLRRAAAVAKFIYDFSNYSENVEKSDQFKLIQFHPSYSYEDFVRGIVTETIGDAIEYKSVNKVLGDFAAKALANWKNSKKDSVHTSKENKVREYFETFVDELSDSLSSGPIKLTENISLVDVEAEVFRYKGEDGWSTLGNKMPFKDIIQAFIDDNKERQDIKKNANLTGLAKQHASYFIRVVHMFREFLHKNNLTFEKLNSSLTPLNNYVIIIDEINRANLSSVLGELIYALEYRGKKVESMYAVDGDNELVLPPNLFIIGTMNTADRSVGHIDYAIRRRFAFVDVPPEDLTSHPGINFHSQLFEQVAALFNNYLSPEFEKKDVQLGHSYFIDKTSDGGTMDIRLQFEIKPILLEYIKDGILVGETIKDEINNLKA